MYAYVVLLHGHVAGIYTSPVDAHLQAKLLDATVEVCQLNAEVTPDCKRRTMINLGAVVVESAAQ